ncbi:MAG: ATP-binding cassette domain-containing protein [Deltaproteobacteria bacterium]|nr:ATP-binding cassette domain-containing protein [Deltaproteobacteria bacterium]
MISCENLSLSFGGRKLFDDVTLKFVPGNCYGVIGANGAGKSTFLKVLSGVIPPSTGKVSITPRERIATLKQDHFIYDNEEVLRTVLMGHTELISVIKEREEIYAKEEFTEKDGDRASELETLFTDLEGWEAESNAAILLAGLGISTELHNKKMRELVDGDKVKVLLAQALFGKPDILLLDEPTNHLDVDAIEWLEDFLMVFEKTVIVVSHDRHFLNTVCTHMTDIDFGKITLFTGNYDFWYESSQLAQRMLEEKNKKLEDKAQELKAFIARFSANKSKSKQATSRRKLLDKLTLDDIRPSSRKYPFFGFKPGREPGDQILKCQDLSCSVDGSELFTKGNLVVDKGNRICVVGDNEIAISSFYRIIASELSPDRGEFSWGVTTSQAYFPKDNANYFNDRNISLIDWMRQYSEEKAETFIRGFLGRFLFSGDDATKKVGVLSGGEKVRCMFGKIVLTGANVLLLDGPTNHLDLESITALNNALMRFPGVILFSSHDHEFNQSLANRVLEITSSGFIDYRMTYDDYLAEKRKAKKSR